MKPYAQEAAETQLAFRAGLLSAAEVIRWADSMVISLDQYDDDLAEIALAAHKPPQELDSMLLHASEGADRIRAIRSILGQMHDAMVQDRSRARDFARFLEQVVVESGYRLPQDLHFLFGLDDEFDLAEQGVLGRVSGVADAFVKSTEPYSRRTGHAEPSSGLPATASGWSRIRWLGGVGRRKQD